ncbi:hypothetical protein GUJ93_ZPchr0013g35190 [Zizania palustris]|uniref:ER membrane protein complex subunit 3 n=1 Tax=Zizania palustris TaxID=103762 RepID=A0A8J5X2F4_ZIZPA|nr:hypothetical protein GUJ93_ZPchr0013g35190 [Zizania palustris]
MRRGGGGEAEAEAEADAANRRNTPRVLRLGPSTRGGELSPPDLLSSRCVADSLAGRRPRAARTVAGWLVAPAPPAFPDQMAEELVLDTAIRDWVLVPLSVVMVLIGVLRYFVAKLMRSPSASPSPDPKHVKEGFVPPLALHPVLSTIMQVVIRARNLRTSAQFIPAKAFKSRKVYYTNEENGLLHVPKEEAQKAQAAMFSDPNMAMDMMKKNLSMIVPQTLTFT